MAKETGIRCIKDNSKDCLVDMKGYGDAVSATLEAIDIIAGAVSGIRGMTGNSNCDDCKQLDIADAITILNAIRLRFELVPVRFITEKFSNS